VIKSSFGSASMSIAEDFFLVSARKLLDRLVFAEGKEYNKRRFGKRFLKCDL
jgi:hypothetical protein